MENYSEYIIVSDQATNFLNYKPQKHPFIESDKAGKSFENSGCVTSHPVNIFEKFMLDKFNNHIYPFFVKLYNTSQQSIKDETNSIPLFLKTNPLTHEEECTLPAQTPQGTTMLNLKLQGDRLIAINGGVCPEFAPC